MWLSYSITKILRLVFYVCHYHWAWILIDSPYNKAVCTARKTAVPIFVKANIRLWFSLLNEDVEFTLWRKHVYSKCLWKLRDFTPLLVSVLPHSTRKPTDALSCPHLEYTDWTWLSLRVLLTKLFLKMQGFPVKTKLHYLIISYMFRLLFCNHHHADPKNAKRRE